MSFRFPLSQEVREELRGKLARILKLAILLANDDLPVWIDDCERRNTFIQRNVELFCYIAILLAIRAYIHVHNFVI